MINPQDVIDALMGIRNSESFPDSSQDLTAKWVSAGGDVSTVEAILRFMEDNPSIDYGIPGPLVHYVETFYGNGYEDLLIESVKRNPTTHTIWMLNRVINGTKNIPRRQLLIETMMQAAKHPAIDKVTVERIKHFVSRLTE